MMKLLLTLIVVALPLSAAVDDAGVFNVSHEYVRVAAMFSANPGTPTVEWDIDTGAPYAENKAMDELNASSRYSGSVNITELTPATLYYMRVCDDGPSGSSCSPEFQVTTNALPSVYPVLPVAPATFSDTYPVSFGRTETFGVAPCDGTFQACIDDLKNDTSADDYKLIIPDSTAVIGTINLPTSATHTGWTVLVWEDVLTASFPPDGVRWTTDWPTGDMPTFISDGFGTGARIASQTLPKTDDTNTVDTSGTTVAKTAGSSFDSSFTSGTPMQINSVWYTISSVDSNSQITLTGSAGTQNGVASLIRTCGGYNRGGLVTTNPSIYNVAWEVFPVFRCAEDNAIYTGELGIASFAGDGTVTVTMDSDISSDLFSGIQVDMPAANGYVADGWYVAYGISGSTFKIQATAIGAYVGSKNLDDVDSRWEHPTYTQGSAKPGSCTDEHWFWDTDETENDLYWCAGGAWTKRREGTTQAGDYAALHFETNASKYWLRGLRITHHPTPQEGLGHPTDWDGGNVVSNQGQHSELVYLDTGTSDIVFEQCWFDGRDYPSRVGRAVLVGGAGPYMFKDSRFDEFVDWIWKRSTQSDGSSAINIASGGTIRIENNYLQAAGITVFTVPRNIDGQVSNTQDITIQRNLFNKKESWRRTTGDVNYPNRHFVETKAAVRVRIIGNTFGYQYGETNAGAAVLSSQAGQSLASTPLTKALSSFTNGTVDTTGSHYLRVGDVIYITGAANNHDGLWEIASITDTDTFVVADPPTGTGSAGDFWLRAPANDVSDWYVGYNQHWQGTEFALLDGDSLTNVEYPPIPRIQITNNLAVDLNIDSYATGGRQSVNAQWASAGYSGCRFVAGMEDVQDVTITHNGVYGCWGLRTSMLVFSVDDDLISGLKMNDNLFRENKAGATDNFIRSQATTFGSAALNAQVLGGQGWTSENNAVCCGWSGVSGDYEASWEWPASDSVVDWHKAQITAGFDFRLADGSPYKSGGASPASDGLDIGPDIDELEVQRGVVSNVRPRIIADTTATISYMAPDTDACTVEHSTSATWGTGTRTGDGGGARVRNVNLTGLNSGTLYYFRVLCRTEQPNGTFVTF